MRLIPASFLIAPSFSRSRHTPRRRPGVWLYGSALLALAGGLSPAVRSASASASALAQTQTQAQAQSVTNATTGLSDAASVSPVAACGSANATRATCLAQILRVRGTLSLVHPRLRTPSSPFRLRQPRSRRSRGATPAIAAAEAPAAGPPQPGTPAYLQQAYDLAYLSQTGGAGTTVAVVDAFDDPKAEADLATYRSEFGLPACTTANGCFTKVDQNGGTNYPAPADTGWELEISLDLDAVSALCPNCNIMLVEANTDQVPDSGQIPALATAQMEAYKLGATVISDSWDVPQTSGQARVFEKSGYYTFRGATTVAASGDAGYPGPTLNDFPAALAGVTAAGGTTLEPASSSGVQTVRAFTESAWSEAGSGCNLSATKPTYQTDSGCTGRSYADISADADPNTGMQVYDSADGGWVVAGGTSEAAPLIAAYYAVVGSSAQGPAWAYANASLLNDPSTGSNGSCSASISYICNAGPGYDGPTGVGSISGAVTTGAPGITGPGTNGSYAQNVTVTSAQLQGGVYPNGEDTTYWWEYGTTSAYGKQTPATDIGSGTSPVPVADLLSGLSPGTTYHYRLVAQNSLGTEYGYDFTLTTPTTTNSSNRGVGEGATQPAQPTTTSAPSPVQSGGSPGSGGRPTGAPVLTDVRIGPAATTATVTATIATRGAATTYTLQYGTTRALGRSLSGSLAAPSSRTARNLSATVRNLSPGKIYYVRVLASNAGGSAGTAVIRFRTSPVTVTGVRIRGDSLVVVLRCHGSAACRVRLQGRSGSRVLLVASASIRANRSQTVTVPLAPAFRTLSRRARSAARLLVLSSWNGTTATVSAGL